MELHKKSIFNKKLLFLIITVTCLIFLFSSTIISAAPYDYKTPSLNIDTARIKEAFTGGFLKWYEVQDWKTDEDGIRRPVFDSAFRFQRTAVDFVLFFGIFAVLVYIAFFKLLKGVNKGALLALALFLGMALAISLTVMLENPITELFYPFAVHLIYLLVAAMFFWFFFNVVFQKSKWPLALLLALLLTWIAFGTLGIKVNCPDWLCGEYDNPTTPPGDDTEITVKDDDDTIGSGIPAVVTGDPVISCESEYGTGSGWKCTDKPSPSNFYCPGSASDTRPELCDDGKVCMKLDDCQAVCGSDSITEGYSCRTNINDYNCDDKKDSYHCTSGTCAIGCTFKPVNPPPPPPQPTCPTADTVLNSIKAAFSDPAQFAAQCNKFKTNYGKRTTDCSGKGYDNTISKAKYNAACGDTTGTI